MKRKVWITLLLVLTAALGLVAFTSCKPKDNPVNVTDIEGAESGTYYFDVSSEEEYDLSLSNGNKFTLLMRDVTRAGEYTLDGEKLTLNFSEPYTQTVEATYRNGEITLTYNNLTMRFIKKIYFTVSFDTHGGSSVSSISVVNGRSIGKVTDPEREGYTFLGWYTDEAYSTSFAFDSQPVTGDITLHARWQAAAAGAGFKVSFDLNYDNAPTLDPVTTVGGKILDLQDPRREGFLFAGWYVSQYGSKDQLSYAVDSNTVIKENVTLYATWEEPGNSGKLQMPRVGVTEQGLSWNAVGANTYVITVKGPAGFADVNETTTSTSFPIEFATAPAGEYTITVQGTASNTANNSNVVTLHYKNKALARVSLFEVVSPATLLFNAVDHAREYLISIDCGNKKHVHTAVSNGNSTYYNFANCSMQKGGIKFRVTARANGYVESVSEEFAYERNLDAVTNVRVDDNQLLSWDAVQGATNYILSITCSNGAHEHSRVDVGNATSYSLKECGKGEVKVTITATTKGYNSADPVEYSYNKATIASPSHFLLKGTTLSWDAVEGASTYTLRIAGKTYTTDKNSFDFATIKDISWSSEEDYQASVQALTSNDPSSNSLFSEGVDMRYYALYSSLDYNRSTLSWRHVIGVTKYEVSLNGTTLGTVENGENFYNIKFTRAGDNTLSVRFFDDESNLEGSDWVSIDVFTYTIEFDTRGGEAVKSIYVAYGDKLDLPTTTRLGYVFDAWYNVPGGAEKNGAPFDSEYYLEATDIRLYASYDSREYTVKYVYGDSRDEASDPTVKEGKVLYGKQFTLDVPAAPDQTVVFLGWFSKKDGRGIRYTDEKGNSLRTWAIAENGTEVFAYFAKTLSYTLVNNEYYSVSAGPGLVLLDEVTIPKEYDGKPVKAIPGFAFLNATTLKRIHIPNSIDNLNLDAFKGCTKIEEFDIYDAGTAASDVMFRSNSGVISIKESNTWTLYLYPVARSGDFVIPDDITAIAPGFFSGSRITKLTVPAGVNDVSLETFKDCLYLREVVFEDSSEEGAELSIYTGAFTNCPALRTVTFPKQLKTYGAVSGDDQSGVNTGKAGVFVNCNRLENVLMSGAGNYEFTVVDGMLVYQNNLIFIPATKVSETFTVPSGITGIGDYLFERAAYPYNVEIPAWVTYIGKDVFHGNTGLQTVTFKASSSGLAAKLEIGEEAFFNCAALTEMTFEDGCGVQTLGKRALYQCDALTELVLPKSLEVVGDEAFGSCNALASITFTEGSAKLEIGMSIFSDCTSLAEIKLPSSISKIEYGSFEGANTEKISITPGGKYYTSENNVVYGLKDGDGKTRYDLVYYPKNLDIKGTTLPETLEKIGSFVFRGNTKLTEIKIPKNVNWIGVEAFSGATNLTTVTFEGKDTVDKFEFAVDDAGMSYAFRNCTSLGGLELPSKLEVIPGGFLYMDEKSVSALSTFTIPESVKTIGNQAFYHSNIQALNITAKVETIGDDAFYDSNITSLTFAGESSNAPGSEGEFVPVADDGVTGALISIGDRAFYAAKFTTLDLPDSLTKIGSNAFENTRINRLTLGKGVKTIGNYAFQGCTSLNSVTISSDIDEMGTGVFERCAGLINMDFAQGVKTIPSGLLNSTSVSHVKIAATVEKIAAGALSSSNITQVDIDDNSNLTTIEERAFSNSRIGTLEVPNKVTTLGNNAFSNCSMLRTITLPLSLTSIGDSAFEDCGQLTTITFNSTDVTEAESLTLGKYVFKGCSSLTTLTLPKTVSSLGENIFENSGMTNFSVDTQNQHITVENDIVYDKDKKTLYFALPQASGTVNIPKTVEYINDHAFTATQVTAITSEAGGSAVLHIGSKATIESEGSFVGTGSEGAFQNSWDSPSVITSVALPTDRDVWIGGNAFNSCSALTSITLGQTKHIGDHAFESSGLTTITLPEGLVDLGDNALSSCSVLACEIKFPSSLEKLGQNVFTSSRQITGFKFSENKDSKLTVIGPSAFAGALAPFIVQAGQEPEVDLEIPDYVTTIEDSAFNNAWFKTITIGTGVKEIKRGFYYSWFVEEIKFKENGSLETISEDAFRGMEYYDDKCQLGLKKITNIPKTLKTIGTNAFMNCKWLKEITFEEGGQDALVIGDPQATSGVWGVFYECESLEKIELPARVTTITPKLFAGCTKLEKVVLPTSLTSIPEQAFASCTSLTEVEIPESAQLTEIGDQAFASCPLTSFTLPATVTKIGNRAFYQFGADGLTFTINVDSKTGKGALETIESEAFMNSKITEFDFSKTKVETFESAAFANCSKLKKIDLDGLHIVPREAFRNCQQLSDIEWGTTITSIENGAFWKCKAITELDLPAQLEAVGSFNSVAQMESYYGENSTRYVGAFECTGITEVDFSNADALKTIGSGAFYGTKLSGKIELSDHLERLCPYAFGGTEVTELDLPSTLQAVSYTTNNGSTAYVYITNNSLSIPNLQAINVREGEGNYSSIDGVLYYSSAQSETKVLMAWPVKKEADLSNQEEVAKYFEGVSQVYDYAFYKNEGLEGKDVDLSSMEIERFGTNSIAETGVKSLKLPGASLGESAFANNKNLEKVEFTAGDTTETFGTTPFYASNRNLGGSATGCPKLTEITLPSDLAAIPAYFLSNTAVTSIKVPASVTSIGDYAFALASLTSVEFEGERANGLKLVLGNAVFQNTAITEIVLPDDTTFAVNSSSTYPYQGNNMFNGCKQLVKVTLPESIPYLNGNFFMNCEKLTTIVGLEDLELDWIENGVFEGCTLLVSGKEVKEGEESAEDDDWMTLNVKELKDGIVSSKNSMFANSGIKKLKFTSSLTWIDSYQLSENTSLEEVDMSEATNVHISGAIFNGDSNLKTVKFPKGDIEWVSDSNATTFGSVGSLETVELGEDITTLPAYFTSAANTPSLKTVTFKENSKLHTIGAYALQGIQAEIETFNLPASVETIGEGAFMGTKIKAFDFGTGSKLRDIGKEAFSEMAITTFNVPDTVTALGDGVFKDCTALEKVTGCDKIDTIPAELFSGCEALNEVPDKLIKSAKSVGNSAFNGCKTLNTAFNFENADIVGTYAFQGCEGLTSVKLPKATAIPEGCFSGCKTLTTVEFDDVESVGASAFEGCAAITSVDIGNATAVVANTFKGCAKLTSINLKKVKSIGESAFEGCTELGKITMEDTCKIETIGRRAFFGCEKLGEFTLKEGLLDIGEEAFGNCTTLKSLNIPKSVSSIGDGAFRGVQGITVDENNATYKAQDNALYDKDQKTLISFNGDTNYTVPATVESIRPYAFAESKVQKIGFANDSAITSISNFAFADARALSELDFTNATKLTTLGGTGSYDPSDSDSKYLNLGRLFRNTALTHITIPASVTTLSSYIFADSKITKVEFAQGSQLTKLPDYAFYGVDLTEYKIPDNIKELGKGVFMNCTKLTKIEGGKEVKELSDSLFNGCVALNSIAKDLWEGVTHIGADVFRGCKLLTNDTFKGNLDSVTTWHSSSSWSTAEGTFAGTGITSLEWLPENATKLGNKWFEGCEKLTSVEIPDQIEEIGQEMFAGVPLTRFEVSDDNPNSWMLNYAGSLFAGIIPNEDKDLTIEISLPSENMTMLIGSNLFANIEEMKTLTIKLTGIQKFGGSQTFYLSNIENVVIQSTDSKLTEFGDYSAFASSRFKSLDIPKTVTKFGSNMLDGSSYLEDLKFDGESAVKEEEGVKTFTLPTHLTSIAADAFKGVNLGNMVIPAEIQPSVLQNYALRGYGAGWSQTTITVMGDVSQFTGNKLWCATATVVDKDGNPVTV